MSLQFASLGSGSRGNATVIRSENALILIDNGFTIKETERRLQQLGHSPQDLSAILVTHEHSDHIKGVAPLARKYQLPVYLTHGTAQYNGISQLHDLHEINLHRPFAVADIEVKPVAVPHDAREPCQFVVSSQNKTLGVLTDLGSITPFVIEQYRLCDALMLECNHDPKMLATGPYPPSLKQRVGGRWGHLSNHQAADLLQNIEIEKLEHLVLCHISEKNNTEALARDSIKTIYGENKTLHLADQEQGLTWLAI